MNGNSMRGNYAVPRVDASVMRLAGNTTLLLEDAVSIRDIFDRRIDTDVKKTYQVAGGACKPAVALTSVSRAARTWTDNIELALKQGIDSDNIIKTLGELKLASDFIAEAAIDILKCLAQTMLYSITWSADPSSTQTWCKILYDGKALAKNWTAISRVTGRKSGLIAQDKNRRRNFTTSRATFQQKSREARTCKTGRKYWRGWKGSQATFLKMAKVKSNLFHSRWSDVLLTSGPPKPVR